MIRLIIRLVSLLPLRLRKQAVWLFQASMGMRILEDLTAEIRVLEKLHPLALARANGRLIRVVDVGANRGLYSKSLLGAFPNSRITLVEPNFKIIDESLLRDERVNLLKVAVSDFDGEAELLIPNGSEDSSGLASLHARKVLGEPTERLRVRVSRLEGLIREPVDLIKIDVEGSEVSVMIGARDLLEKHKPILQFEYGGAWIDSRNYLRDAFTYLEGLDYQIFRPVGLKLLGPLTYEEDFENFRFANYLAVPKGSL